MLPSPDTLYSRPVLALCTVTLFHTLPEFFWDPSFALQGYLYKSILTRNVSRSRKFSCLPLYWDRFPSLPRHKIAASHHKRSHKPFEIFVASSHAGGFL